MAYLLEVEPFQPELEFETAPAVRKLPASGTLSRIEMTIRISKTTLAKIPVRSFNYEVKSPRDAASGQTSGKRQHQPLKVLIPWDSLSVQLFGSLVANTRVDSVLLEIDVGDPTPRRFGTIELNQAFVASVRQFAEASGTSRLLATLAEVTFVFRKIEVTQGGITATDDWLTV